MKSHWDGNNWAEISKENKNVKSVNLHENVLQAGFFFYWDSSLNYTGAYFFNMCLFYSNATVCPEYACKGYPN